VAAGKRVSGELFANKFSIIIHHDVDVPRDAMECPQCIKKKKKELYNNDEQ
jgi:hypothetical protein